MESLKKGFLILIFGFAFICEVYALDLNKTKLFFLSQDYKSAIQEGEKIMATAVHSAGLDELYYILGLSYMKEGNLLRASDIFEIILKEFRDSKFSDEARLGLGDVYFLKNEYDKAECFYQDLMKNNARSKFLPLVYYRLSELEFKKGNVQQGNIYLDKLKKEFPLNLELKLNNDLCVLPDKSSDAYYSVQVGSFSSSINATNLCNNLNSKGYEAYIQEVKAEDKKFYKVRVGKLKSHTEAVNLNNRLSQEGYPTKICP